MLRNFRYVALLEGISYIIILFNMLAIKPTNMSLYKTLLFPFGMTHGVLFIAYVFLALKLRKPQGWNDKTMLEILIGSLIPLGTFYIEKKYLKNV
ncbi:DUF3817 domain-containing protein [Flavobacterium sp.]|uniref:DUF3817 domain-containing protein n=1 Tax=Flavobacterium sp. TaxID=239 RepID=UPI003D0F1940